MKYVIQITNWNEDKYYYERYFSGHIGNFKLIGARYAHIVQLKKAKRYWTRRKAERVLSKIKKCANGHSAQIVEVAK